MTFARASRPLFVASTAFVACATLSACASAGQSLGFGKTMPDEFRVVAKAPLVVPPDYALRPPALGEPRPQELQPESQARLALLGRESAVSRSQGETLLAARAGAAKADPLIRYVVDDEYGSLAHKDQTFADRVMFWKKPTPDPIAQEARTNAQIAAASPIDAATEEARVKALTGDKPIVIKREPKKKHSKLPGL